MRLFYSTLYLFIILYYIEDSNAFCDCCCLTILFSFSSCEIILFYSLFIYYTLLYRTFKCILWLFIINNNFLVFHTGDFHVVASLAPPSWKRITGAIPLEFTESFGNYWLELRQQKLLLIINSHRMRPVLKSWSRQQLHEAGVRKLLLIINSHRMRPVLKSWSRQQLHEAGVRLAMPSWKRSFGAMPLEFTESFGNYRLELRQHWNAAKVLLSSSGHRMRPVKWRSDQPLHTADIKKSIVKQQQSQNASCQMAKWSTVAYSWHQEKYC